MAVGAARGNQELKQHITRTLETWVLVGSLILATVFGMLGIEKQGWQAPIHVDIVDDETCMQILAWLAWVYGLSCCVTGALTVLGPIIVGSVLAVNISSCSDLNFDLFLEAGASTFRFNERLVVLMLYSLSLQFLLLPFVVQQNVLVGLIIDIPLLLLAGCMLYHINLVSAVNLRGGLFSDAERACAVRPWQPNAEDKEPTTPSDAGRSVGALLGRYRRTSACRGGAHDQVVDALVRRVLESQALERRTEDVVRNYHKARAGGSAGSGGATFRRASTPSELLSAMKPPVRGLCRESAGPARTRPAVAPQAVSVAAGGTAAPPPLEPTINDNKQEEGAASASVKQEVDGDGDLTLRRRRRPPRLAALLAARRALAATR